MKLNYYTYRTALKRMLNTDDGKLVLAYLNLNKVKQSAFGRTPEETYAKLGVKEFIQGLINDANDPREIEDLTTQAISDQENTYE